MTRNTVLLAVLALGLFLGGSWWLSHRAVPAPAAPLSLPPSWQPQLSTATNIRFGAPGQYRPAADQPRPRAAKPLPDFVKSYATNDYRLPCNVLVGTTLTVMQPGAYPVDLDVTLRNKLGAQQQTMRGFALHQKTRTRLSGAPAYRTLVKHLTEDGASIQVFESYIATRNDSVWIISVQHPDFPQPNAIATTVMSSMRLY